MLYTSNVRFRHHRDLERLHCPSSGRGSTSCVSAEVSRSPFSLWGGESKRTESLAPTAKQRVDQTLLIAKDLQTRGAAVRIVWTGGKSRALVKAGIVVGGPGSEGAAMAKYAREQGSTYSSQVEGSSTTTVENITRSASLVDGRRDRRH